MCHEEPAVRHVVIALGAAHHFYLRKPLRPDTREEHISMSRFECVATQHYNKAIRELMDFDSVKSPTSWNSQLNMLICCLLFICLENILDRFDEAIRHMKAGCRLLKSCDPRAAPPHSQQLMQEIATVFVRFGVDASVLAHDCIIPNLTPYAMPLIEIHDKSRPFSDLTHAKDAIWDLDVRMSHTDFNQIGHANQPSEESDTCNQIREFATPFERWKSKFNLLVSSLGNTTNLTIDIQREILVLKARSCMWDIILLPINDDNYQELLRLCYGLTDVAESLYKIEASWLNRPIFTLDSDSIPALFHVAHFCEDVGLVQRIVDLLRRSRRREGPWDSGRVANMLQLRLQSPASKAL
jgi:hypothetical protein